MVVRPQWLQSARFEIPVGPKLEHVTAPITDARRRLGTLTAWAAIVAVAGISYAVRRRQGSVDA